MENAYQYDLWTTPSRQHLQSRNDESPESRKGSSLNPRETCITQALKAYIKLKGTLLSILLNIGASISAISKNLAQKFQLKVEANNGTRVSPLEGNPKVKIVGLVKEILLSI